MKPEDFLEELEGTLERCEFREVGPLLDRIDPTDFSPVQAKTTLGKIRRKRLFAELERAASLFFLAGHEEPVIRRQWAQSLLDQSRVGQGLAALRTLLPRVEADAKEGPEVRGLVGRAHKQRFVDEGDAADLRSAIQAYRQDWDAHPETHRWHGINLVALLKRAEQENIGPGVEEQPEPIARRILQDVEQLDEPSVWDYGTAMEAAVALDDKPSALGWAAKYARHPGADAFELGSTLRQMKEVWRLEGTELGRDLLPVLEYELLQREGGSLQLGDEPIGREGFEAVYGEEGTVPLAWMETLRSRTLAVARVFDPQTGKIAGTGFLVRGSDLSEGWDDALVFLTNSHVISDNPADEAPLSSNQGSAEFTRLAGRPTVSLGAIRYSSPKYQLDVSVLSLVGGPPPGAEPLVPSMLRPALPEGDEKERIYVIGHPGGRELEVSLYDNELREYAEPYVRYRSPTEAGNSGSPVFNRRWDCFAIHHRARGSVSLNEGVLLKPIKAAIP